MERLVDPSESIPAVSIVVPCWNEAESLPPLFERLGRLIAQNPGWEVLFVNDGSRDDTARLLDQAGARFAWARVAHHPQNQGLGAGVRTGFQRTQAPVVCTIDSDGTYPPECLPEFVRRIRQGADIVTASPWHPDNKDADGAWHRVLMSRTVSLGYRLTTRSSLYTYTALFRAYRREVIDSVPFESDGFPAVTEILVKAIGKGFKVDEVAMPLKPREHGESKMTVTKAIRGHLRMLALSARWARQA